MAIDVLRQVVACQAGKRVALMQFFEVGHAQSGKSPGFEEGAVAQCLEEKTVVVDAGQCIQAESAVAVFEFRMYRLPEIFQEGRDKLESRGKRANAMAFNCGASGDDRQTEVACFRQEVECALQDVAPVGFRARNDRVAILLLGNALEEILQLDVFARVLKCRAAGAVGGDRRGVGQKQLRKIIGALAGHCVFSCMEIFGRAMVCGSLKA